jgi:predicted thioredoxin/glutaredoxin
MSAPVVFVVGEVSIAAIHPEASVITGITPARITRAITFPRQMEHLVVMVLTALSVISAMVLGSAWLVSRFLVQTGPISAKEL